MFRNVSKIVPIFYQSVNRNDSIFVFSPVYIGKLHNPTFHFSEKPTIDCRGSAYYTKINTMAASQPSRETVRKERSL